MKILEKIQYGEHPMQTLNLYIPECEAFPLVVYFHGGGFVSGKPNCGFIKDLVNMGVAVVSGTYRKYPDAKYPEFIEDGASVVKWAKDNVKKYGNVTDLFVVGTSAGGYITLSLCFDKKYLAKHNLSNDDITAYYHNTPQATTHFNILKERGMDVKKVVVDDAAPLYHVGEDNDYPPMAIAVTSTDLALRHEQAHLLIAALKNYGFDMDKIDFSVIEGNRHGDYVFAKNENDEFVFAKILYNFIEKRRTR